MWLLFHKSPKTLRIAKLAIAGGGILILCYVESLLGYRTRRATNFGNGWWERGVIAHHTGLDVFWYQIADHHPAHFPRAWGLSVGITREIMKGMTGSIA